MKMLRWFINFIKWLFVSEPKRNGFPRFQLHPLSDIHDKSLMIVAEQVAQQGLLRAGLFDVKVQLISTTLNSFDGPMRYIREENTIYINRAMPRYMREIVGHRPGLSAADVTTLYLAFEIGDALFDISEYNSLASKLSKAEGKYQWSVSKSNALHWLHCRQNIELRMLYVVAENGRAYLSEHDGHLIDLFNNMYKERRQDDIAYFTQLKNKVAEMFDEVAAQ